jgi:hypothetical protein
VRGWLKQADLDICIAEVVKILVIKIRGKIKSLDDTL